MEKSGTLELEISAPGEDPLPHIFSLYSAAKGAEFSLRIPERYEPPNSIYVPSGMNVLGKKGGASSIHRKLPPDASLDEIANRSTVDFFWSGSLQDLTIEATNLRYAVHIDNPELPEFLAQRIERCRIVHNGNESAPPISADAGLDSTQLWRSENAMGIGLGSGWRLDIIDSTLIGQTAAIGVHNAPARHPSQFRIQNSKLVARSTTAACLQIANMGSGQKDLIEIVDSSVPAIHYFSPVWFPTDLKNQPADHSEFDISGSGNGDILFSIQDFGRALKIESASDGTISTIGLSGTACRFVFGKVFEKPGCRRLKGYAYGWADISGTAIGAGFDVVITRLGQRLGDCTQSPKRLTVEIDRAHVVHIDFDRDFSQAPNAQILEMMNEALLGLATCSEYAVGERYRPRFGDQEITSLNCGDAGIRMGEPCRRGRRPNTVELFRNNDPAAEFAGIALEDIYPGAEGRVKTAGVLPASDIAGDVNIPFVRARNEVVFQITVPPQNKIEAPRPLSKTLKWLTNKN